MWTPSSTWARWLAGTALFGLALVGVMVVFVMFPRADRALFWVLDAGLAALALALGVRLRTWWWVLGPLVSFGMLATIFLIVMNAEDQARPNIEKGLGYAILMVMIVAAVVILPSTLAALAGAAWSAASRVRADRRRRGECSKRWSDVRRFLTMPDETD